MRKRVLSLCMALALCLSLLPVPISAGEMMEDVAQNVRQMANTAEEEVVEDVEIVFTESSAVEDAEEATVEAEEEAEESSADVKTAGAVSVKATATLFSAFVPCWPLQLGAANSHINALDHYSGGSEHRGMDIIARNVATWGKNAMSLTLGARCGIL